MQTWTLNQDAARAAKAPEPMLGHIAEVLSAIEPHGRRSRPSARPPSISRAASPGRWLAVRARWRRWPRRRRHAVGGLLEPGHPPIWNAQWWMGARPVDVSTSARSPPAGGARSSRSSAIPPPGVRTHGVLFVALAVLLWAARRWTHRVGGRGGRVGRDRGVRSSLLRRAAHRPDEPSLRLWPAGAGGAATVPGPAAGPGDPADATGSGPAAVPWPPHAGRRVHPRHRPKSRRHTGDRARDPVGGDARRDARARLRPDGRAAAAPTGSGCRVRAVARHSGDRRPSPWSCSPPGWRARSSGTCRSGG